MNLINVFRKWIDKVNAFLTLNEENARTKAKELDERSVLKIRSTYLVCQLVLKIIL